MEKSFDLLNRIFNDVEMTNPLCAFVAGMAEEERSGAIEKCKKEKDRKDPVEEAFTWGVYAGMTAGFNVGFVYGNMFEVVDPEGKEYVEALRKKLIHDGTLMYVPKKRVAKAA
jgi:hypothetical protein